MTTRRLFLLGAASLIAAPAVIRTAGLLMPIKPLVVPPAWRWSPTVGLYQVEDHKVVLIRSGPWLEALAAQVRSNRKPSENDAATAVRLAQRLGLIA